MNCLSPSRSSGGLTSGSTSLGVDTSDGAVHSSSSLAGGRSSGSRGLSVAVDVEGNEEEEVGGQETTAVDGSKLLAGTVAHVGHPGPVRGGEVGVRGKVDKAQIDDELDDLQPGDPLLPPHSDASRGQEVVEVHDNVNKQVEDNGDPRDGGSANQLGVAEKGGGTVVVGVQEGELLLSQHQEHGVDELKVLGQVVEVVAENNGLGPRSVVADGVQDAVSHEDGEQLLDEKHKEHAGEQGQEHVVDLEEPVESDRREVLHHLSAAKDDSVVDDDGGHNGGVGREGDVGVVSVELEGRGGPSEQLGPGLVKHGPEVDTEGSVHRGNLDLKRVSAWVSWCFWACVCV